MAQPLPAGQIQAATETSAECKAGALPASSRLPTDLAEPRLSARQSLANKLLVLAVLGLAAGAYAYSMDRSLVANETYSALAAFQPSIGLVAQNALRFDPGKPVLYHILLHWFCGIFGHSEASIRAMSMFFGVATLALLFALGQDLFGFGIGIVAALLWAFNPEALVTARLGRMYSLFTALALAHVWAISRLLHKQTPGASALAGLAGGAMLYTHLDGVLIIAADCVVVVREFRRDGRRRPQSDIARSHLFSPTLFAISPGRGCRDTCPAVRSLARLDRRAAAAFGHVQIGHWSAGERSDFMDDARAQTGFRALRIISALPHLRKPASARADRRIINRKAHVPNTVRESILRIRGSGIGLFAGQRGLTSQKSRGGRCDGASVCDLRSALGPVWAVAADCGSNPDFRKPCRADCIRIPGPWD